MKTNVLVDLVLIANNEEKYSKLNDIPPPERDEWYIASFFHYSQVFIY